MLERWRANPSRPAWRQLQPYVVSVYKRDALRHLNGYLSMVDESGELYEWVGDYDERIGIAQIITDPSDLIYVV